MTLNAKELSFINIKEERSVPGIEESMLACYLPPELGLKFPSLLDIDKQSRIIAPNVLFRRIKEVDNERFENTISLLNQGPLVMWIGHEDIGKSLEATFLLMKSSDGKNSLGRK